VWNILWSPVDFFLTSFLLPTILPNQTRGKKFDDDLLPGIDQRSNGPGYTENLEGKTLLCTAHGNFWRGLAGLFYFFGSEGGI
jgi:hypothetical protein